MVPFGAGEVMFSAGGRLSTHHRRDVDLYVDTQDVDGLYDRIKDRVEIVEGPHNIFYGMREIIVRDLNGFWITFGQQLPADVLTPWPPVDVELLQPYAGKCKNDVGSGVLITIHEGRLLAFPDDAPGVLLMLTGKIRSPDDDGTGKRRVRARHRADDSSDGRAGWQHDQVRSCTVSAYLARCAVRRMPFDMRSSLITSAG